jgi:hypothetical protein
MKNSYNNPTIDFLFASGDLFGNRQIEFQHDPPEGVSLTISIGKEIFYYYDEEGNSPPELFDAVAFSKSGYIRLCGFWAHD